MRPSIPQSAGRPAERGTASMEALLCLPFVLLIFALTINIGHGWLVRLRAEGSGRFAAEHYLAARELGVAPAPARRNAEAAALTHWHPGPGDARVRLRDGGVPFENTVAAGGEGPPSLPDALERVGRAITGRQSATVRFPRRPPTGTLLPPTPVTTAFEVDGNTWPHAEIPLTLDGLTDAGKHNDMPHGVSEMVAAISYAVDGFFWLLGMKP